MNRHFLTILSTAILLAACADKIPEDEPQDKPGDNPQEEPQDKPEEEKPDAPALLEWDYAIGNLLQTPQASKVFNNICPVFSPDGRTVYYQSDSKNIIAVDVESGTVKWQTNATMAINAGSNTQPTQLAVNPVTGEIYGNCHISSSEKNVFFAMDPETGRVTKKLDDVAIYGSNLSGPAISADGKVIYIGTTGVSLRVVGAEDFSMLGNVPLFTGFRGVVTEGSSAIALTNYDEVRIITYDPDATDGFPVRFSAPISGYGAYAVTTSYPCLSPDGRSFYFPAADKDVFGGVTPTEGYVVRLDLGTLKYTKKTVEGATYVWNVMADSEGCIYATCKASTKDRGGFIRKFSADLGTVLWTWTVPTAGLDWWNGLNRISPAMDENGNLYVLSRENSAIYRIDGNTGKGVKLLDPPAGAKVGGCQYGVNIAGDCLVTAFSGDDSGVVAGARIDAGRARCWASAGGDICGSKCYESVWGRENPMGEFSFPSVDQNTFMFDAKPISQLRQDLLDYLDATAASLASHPLAAELSGLKADVEAASGDPFAWIDQVNTFVTRTIKKYPPMVDDATTEPGDVLKARRALLILRDFPMHVVSLTDDVVGMDPGQADAFSTSSKKFFQGSVDALVEWLDKPSPEMGHAEIFKIYNMGYVVKTHNHCFGIDIYFWGTNAQRTAIANHIEALFVSHAHGDHYDVNLMSEFSGMAGKHMFMTTNTSTRFSSKGSATIHIWDDNSLEDVDVNGMTVRAAIGAQTPEPCLLFCTEADGFIMWFAGDNNLEAPYVYAEANFPCPHVTMLIAAGDVASMTKHAKKAAGNRNVNTVHFTSHENEIHHQISGRVSYRFFLESPRRLKDSNFSANLGNFVSLDCGECITLDY